MAKTDGPAVLRVHHHDVTGFALLSCAWGLPFGDAVLRTYHGGFRAAVSTAGSAPAVLHAVHRAVVSLLLVRLTIPLVVSGLWTDSIEYLMGPLERPV